MKLYIKFGFIFFFFLFFSCSPVNYSYKTPENINDGILIGSLQEAKLDSLLLIKMTKSINENEYINVHSILISRYNRLVYEEYFNGYKKEDTHELRSAAKSIGSALTGIAIDKGI